MGGPTPGQCGQRTVATWHTAELPTGKLVSDSSLSYFAYGFFTQKIKPKRFLSSFTVGAFTLLNHSIFARLLPMYSN